jgi:hypothetical protein
VPDNRIRQFPPKDRQTPTSERPRVAAFLIPQRERVGWSFLAPITRPAYKSNQPTENPLADDFMPRSPAISGTPEIEETVSSS